MGCASLNSPLIIKDNPPVNSMSKCPPLLKDGHYKTFGEVVEKLTDVIGMYNECAKRHEGLVDYEVKK